MDKRITVGMDMGDKNHSVCVLDAEGEVQKRTSVTNTARAIQKHFSKLPPCRIALEAGTHSGWISRILEGMGHDVLVGNPRKSLGEGGSIPTVKPGDRNSASLRWEASAFAEKLRRDKFRLH